MAELQYLNHITVTPVVNGYEVKLTLNARHHDDYARGETYVFPTSRELAAFLAQLDARREDAVVYKELQRRAADRHAKAVEIRRKTIQVALDQNAQMIDKLQAERDKLLKSDMRPNAPQMPPAKRTLDIARSVFHPQAASIGQGLAHYDSTR